MTTRSWDGHDERVHGDPEPAQPRHVSVALSDRRWGARGVANGRLRPVRVAGPMTMLLAAVAPGDSKHKTMGAAVSLPATRRWRSVPDDRAVNEHELAVSGTRQGRGQRSRRPPLDPGPRSCPRTLTSTSVAGHHELPADGQ